MSDPSIPGYVPLVAFVLGAVFGMFLLFITLYGYNHGWMQH